MKVRGEGPLPSSVMVVGEGPGWKEEKYGRPFIGNSGQELDRYLRVAGLHRENVYITNLVKYRVPDDGDPTQEDIDRDEAELTGEIRSCSPLVIVTLGQFATRYFLGPDVSMETHHALPWKWRSKNRTLYTTTVFPIYHPAAGLHNPETMSLCWWGWRQLARYMKTPGVITTPKDQYPEPFYREITDGITVAKLLPIGSTLPVAIDTEGELSSPWCLSFTTAPGQGYVIRTGNTEALAALNRAIQSRMVILHNALWDLPVLRAMGVTVTSYVDTMVMAYLLGNQPQGLKTLAFRHAGMAMKSFTELTAATDNEIAANYLTAVSEQGWLNCHECNGTGRVPGKRKGTTKKCPTCKGSQKSERWDPPVEVTYDMWGDPVSVSQPWTIRRMAESILGSDGGDLRRRWNRLPQERRDPAEDMLGPMPPLDLDLVPREEFLWYAARDADATLRVWRSLSQSIKDFRLENILALDVSVIPIIERMQSTGILLDPDHMNRLDDRLEKECREIRQGIWAITDEDVNPSSTHQVGKLLYDKLGMTPPAETKGGLPSTDDKAIQTLQVQSPHPVLDLISDYRERDKLRGTYTKPLPKLIGTDGRVRTRFKITRTATGRLASAEPNLMNQPARSELGKQIRAGFVAKPGYLLGAWDLDQIEMRVLAHESNDPNLVKLFHTGEDIHRFTASKVYCKPPDLITDTERTLAKNVGFGIVYGITPEGLQQQMYQRGIDVTAADCKKMIDDYLEVAYPGVLRFMKEKTEEARRWGYVRDMFGRIRWATGVWSNLSWVQEAAVRQIGNFPIQSGAQGIIKLAMKGVWERALPTLWDCGYDIQPILQIHDELVFEFEEGLEEILDAVITAEMTSPLKLRVPLGAKGHWGKRWSDLK